MESVLSQKRPYRDPLPFHHVGHSKKEGHFITKRRALTSTEYGDNLTLDFQPSEQEDINFCFLEAMQVMALWYSSLTNMTVLQHTVL